MSGEAIRTYQLLNEGNPDVVLRKVPPSISISEAVERQKGQLDLFGGRVGVRVFEGDQPRDLTPDEAEELEPALEKATGAKITVYPA